MDKRIFGEWKTIEDIRLDFTNFDGDCPMPENIEVLFAWYDVQGYEGSCVVLYRQGDTLYFNSGAHCSCNGLDDQWSPDEMTWQTASLVMTSHVFNRDEMDEETRAGWLSVLANIQPNHPALAEHAELILKHMAKGAHHA